MLTLAPVRPLPALVLCALLLCTLPLPVRAATLYVSQNGNDNNAGTATAPYATIQSAVNNASAGDTITLHAGTYAGNGNRDIDFAGKSLTVNSDNGAARTVIDCGGTNQDRHRAFYFHSKENLILLDGLTIKNGNDRGAVDIRQECTVKLSKCVFTSNPGGGISSSGTAFLTRCSFVNNVDGVSNGGTATLTDCVFTSNTRDDSVGGGVYNAGTATLAGCIFTSNTRGGLSNFGTVSLTECAFIGNIGGGLSNNNATATLTGCTFTANSGGGLSSGGSLSLTNCTFTGNTTGNITLSDAGAGVSLSGTALLTNCTISGNTVTNGDGGGVVNYGNAVIRFCTISGNIATGKSRAYNGTVAQGGGLENNGTATLTDDILWGNTAPNAAEIGTPANGAQTTTVTYCDIQGGLSGTGNIKANPLFVSKANPIMPPITVINVGDADLHLQAGSPCRGAGITIGPSKSDPNHLRDKPDPGVFTDADGQKRPNPPSIGAYEYSANPPKPKKVFTLDVGTANAAGDAALVADAAAVPGAASQAPGIQPAQEHPALAVPPVGPQPRLDPQQENAAFLQLMVTLNTGHYAPSDMAQRIQTELDRGADINVKDGEGFPAVVTAASLSHTDVVQVLLEKGADASRATEQVGKSGAADSNSILHKTANGYQVDIGSAISGLFAKKPKPLYGQTALMLAAQLGQAEMVTLLLAHHADSHAKDSRGKSALDYAAQNHRDDIAQVLKAQEAR